MVLVIPKVPEFSGTKVSFNKDLVDINVGSISEIIAGEATNIFIGTRNSIITGNETIVNINPERTINFKNTFHRSEGKSYSEYITNQILCDDAVHFGTLRTFFGGGLVPNQKKEKSEILKENKKINLQIFTLFLSILTTEIKDPDKIIQLINDIIKYVASLTQKRIESIENQNSLICSDLFANLTIGSDGIIMGALSQPWLQRIPKSYNTQNQIYEDNEEQNTIQSNTVHKSDQSDLQSNKRKHNPKETSLDSEIKQKKYKLHNNNEITNNFTLKSNKRKLNTNDKLTDNDTKQKKYKQYHTNEPLDNNMKQMLKEQNRQYHHFFKDPGKSSAATLYMSPGNLTSAINNNTEFLGDVDPFTVLITHKAPTEEICTVIDQEPESMLLVTKKGHDIYSGICLDSSVISPENSVHINKVDMQEPLVSFISHQPDINNSMQLGPCSTKFQQFTNNNFQPPSFFNITVCDESTKINSNDQLSQNIEEFDIIEIKPKHSSTLNMDSYGASLTTQNDKGGKNGIVIAGNKRSNNLKPGLQLVHNDENVLSCSCEENSELGNFQKLSILLGNKIIEITDQAVILADSTFVIKDSNSNSSAEDIFLKNTKGPPSLKNTEKNILLLTKKIECRLLKMTKHLNSTKGFK